MILPGSGQLMDSPRNALIESLISSWFFFQTSSSHQYFLGLKSINFQNTISTEELLDAWFTVHDFCVMSSKPITQPEYVEGKSYQGNRYEHNFIALKYFHSLCSGIICNIHPELCNTRPSITSQSSGYAVMLHRSSYKTCNCLWQNICTFHRRMNMNKLIVISLKIVHLYNVYNQCPLTWFTDLSTIQNIMHNLQTCMCVNVTKCPYLFSSKVLFPIYSLVAGWILFPDLCCRFLLNYIEVFCFIWNYSF